MSWRDCLEYGGLKVNMNKSKIMNKDGNYGLVEHCGRWTCSVCGRGVGRSSIQCTKCLSWVHKRCFGVKNLMKATKDGFVCKWCSEGNIMMRMLKGS